MRIAIVLLIVLVFGCKESIDKSNHSYSEYYRDTLFINNNQEYFVKIIRSVDHDATITTESYSDNGEKFTTCYANNRVNILYKINDDLIINKEFTINDFADICGKEYLSDKILNEITFEKYDPNKNSLEFYVSISVPDTDLDCPVNIKVYANGSYEMEQLNDSGISE